MGDLNSQNPGALRDGGFVILKTPGPYEMQGPGDGGYDIMENPKH